MYKIKSMYYYDKNSHSKLWIHLHGLFSNVKGEKIRFLREFFSEEKSYSFFALDMNYEKTFTTATLDLLEIIVRGFSAEYEHITLCGSSHGGYVATNYIRYRELYNIKELILLAPSFETLALIKNHVKDDINKWLEGKEELTFEEEGNTVSISKEFAKDIIENGYEIIEGDKVHFPENPPVEIKIVHGTRDEVIPIERTRLFVSKVKVKTYVEVEDDHHLDKTIESYIKIII